MVFCFVQNFFFGQHKSKIILFCRAKREILFHNLTFRYKGNNKITELRTILQRESQNSLLYKQTKSVNNRKTVKTVMTLTWYRHF
jgi:hypothetical protein